MRPSQTAIAAFSCLALTGMAFADEEPSAESIAKGNKLFQSNCVACHGADGKAMVDVISDATNLTEPSLYRNGTTNEDILRSIRNGVGGVMPAFGDMFSAEQDLIDLRNFVKSLWLEDSAPTGIF
ncbi:MAG: c-type cytochrome [Paracoccus sp. (in: a-proteobacteria)]